MEQDFFVGYHNFAGKQRVLTRILGKLREARSSFYPLFYDLSSSPPSARCQRLHPPNRFYRGSRISRLSSETRKDFSFLSHRG